MYAFSSITISPVRISPDAGSIALRIAKCSPIVIRIRASTSAGPAVSRMTSSMPHSALTAESPPSVVITITGEPIPVEVSKRVRLLAAGKSRRASMKRRSISGTSTSTLASAGRILTWCWSRASAGSTSALAPRALVRRRTRAMADFLSLHSLNSPQTRLELLG